MNKFQTLTIKLCDNIISFYDFHLRNSGFAFEFQDFEDIESDNFKKVERVKLGTATIGLLYTDNSNEMVLRITSPMLGFECGDVEYSCSVSDKL